MKGGTFKKLFNSVTHNEILLYILLVFALFDLLSYLQTNNLAAVVFFLVTGYVTTLYTKNMSVVFLSAIIITKLVSCLGYLKNTTLQEGLDNSSKSDKTNNSTVDNDDVSESSEDDEPNTQDNKAKPGKSVKMVTIETDTEVNVPKDEKSDIDIDPLEGSKCKKGKHKDPRSGLCVPDADTDTVINKETVKNGSKKVAFSNLNEIDIPLDGNPTMNYKDTVENAYNNLEDLLGSDGIQKMTTDTADLAAKQDQLLNAMNKMGPLMDTAQTMLNSLKGFGLGNLTGDSN
jgi:hypothetical protein